MLEVARKFGESSPRGPIVEVEVDVDVDVDLVVVVDLDGDGGVDLVGRSLTVESNPDATAGEPCRYETDAEFSTA